MEQKKCHFTSCYCSNGSMTDTQGACSSSTASSDCQLCPIVSLLKRLHDPSASELGRN